MTTPDSAPDDPRLIPLDGPDAAVVEDVPHAGVPTQVIHPWKTTLRTIAAYVVALVPVLIVAIPIIADTLGPYLPDAWVAWLLGAAAFLATLAGLVTRLMALPQVQAFLAKVGLGTGVEREPTHRAA